MGGIAEKTMDLRILLAGLREFKGIKELTPIIVNKLIKKMVVHKIKEALSQQRKGGYLLYGG